jgi:phage shock protein PspC (stress-responsive transcriptional regulator)
MDDPKKPRSGGRDRAAKLVKIANGVLAGVSGLYSATSPVLVTVIAVSTAVAVAALLVLVTR